jgi:hypothetical protein
MTYEAIVDDTVALLEDVVAGPAHLGGKATEPLPRCSPRFGARTWFAAW